MALACVRGGGVGTDGGGRGAASTELVTELHAEPGRAYISNCVGADIQASIIAGGASVGEGLQPSSHSPSLGDGVSVGNIASSSGCSARLDGQAA